MSAHQVTIGADVRTSDGHSIGKVTHLIINGEQRTLSAFVTDKGIIDSGKVVDMVYVISSTDDVVQVNLTEKESEKLAGFVKHEMINLSGSQDAWMHLGPSKGDTPGTGSGSLYAQPIPVDAQMLEVGPLGASDIALSHGTDVVDKIGDKVGEVDEIQFDDEGRIRGIMVQKGFIFHTDVFVPFDLVAGVTHEHVRLNVVKEEIQPGPAS
ncbi:MAG: PRC-barrel domain-containing protein [Thermomicrobiales bacterium]